MQCLLCKELIDDDAAYCDQCGEKIKRCVACGAPGKGKVCTKCGARFEQPTSAGSPTQPAQAPPPQPVAPGSGTIRCDNQAAVSAVPLLRLVNNNIHLSVTIQNGSIIGRTSGDHSAVFSAFSQVSSRHCSFACTPAGSWTVTDLGSTNGTFYENRQLHPDIPQTLADQHYLRIANLEFLVQISGA